MASQGAGPSGLDAATIANVVAGVVSSLQQSSSPPPTQSHQPSPSLAAPRGHASSSRHDILGVTLQFTFQLHGIA